MKLCELGEFGFLERLRPRLSADPRVTLGVGDDCAAVVPSDTMLLTMDTLIEGVHFQTEWTSFATLGEKAFTINASDVAAMGGEPRFVLLSIGVSVEQDVERLDELFDGFLRAARACGATLVGGNLTASPCMTITVTLVGEAAHGMVRRSGARVGDDVYVTGTIGDAALGLRFVREGRNGSDEQALIDRFLKPPARLLMGRELARNGASAMIDVSDGLMQDLGHICAESEVGAVIRAAAVPLSPAYRAICGETNWRPAVTGGEDYELLCCAPVAVRSSLERAAPRGHCALTRIGTIVPSGEGVAVVSPQGRVEGAALFGHDHFRLAAT